MGFETDFLDLMPDTLRVNVLKGVSTDGYCSPTYSATTQSYRCRVTEKQQIVTTFVGDEQVAQTIVWINSTSTFGPSDRITLPDGTMPPLLAVADMRDEVGHHHSKAWFK